MNKNETRPPILIFCPMDCEYTTVRSALKESRVSRFGIFEYTEGLVDGYPVVAVECRVGGVNSGAAAMHFIEKYKPLCVLIQGTAGAHDPELCVNDIIIAEDIIDCGLYFAPHRDRGDGSRPTDWEHPGTETLDENGSSSWIGVYHSSERLMKIAEATPYPHGNKRRGKLYSADAWNRELDLIDHYVGTLHTDCEEMENFAVAHICEMFGVEHLGIRVISNSEHLPDTEFSPESATHCQSYCLSVISAIISAEN